MKLVTKGLVAVVLAASTTNAFAFVECTRPLRRVWAGYDGARIYVQFDDGYSDAVMGLTDVANDEQIINRSLAMLVAAVAAGRPVTLRYTVGQDGTAATCTPTVPQKMIGVWLN